MSARVIVPALLLLAGCATSMRDREWLSRELQERTGASLRGDSEARMPPDVVVEDGLDESEVVSLVLWRNPALRAELSRIDAAFASLDEAKRPANPQLTLAGPTGPTTAVATLVAPIESLWQIPARAKAAARDADVAGEDVLMRALDLVRDARLLHVELGLATERAAIRSELARVAEAVAHIAAVRASLGDISPLEERVLAADAQASADARDLAEVDIALAESRLRAVLALDEGRELQPSFATDLATPPALPTLVAFARQARPDARSADLAIEAATAREGWERSRVVNLSAVVEAYWHQSPGPGMRLGGRAELPIFNWNVGGIGRTEAEVQRAAAQHEQLARSVIVEVTAAHARFVQATKSRARFETEVLPALDAALEMAEHGFRSGDQTYLVVLDVLRRAGEARLRRAELVAEQRRALCELERAIGARLRNVDGENELRGTP
ncbi:MAG: TolC family protein [Polyangiaceae bacterium]